jgi:DNA-binding GntR family transcriptional regulator
MHPGLAGRTRVASPAMNEDGEVRPRIITGGAAYIYAQVADDIKHRIDAGEWGLSGQLPSREVLAAEYGVAERTVRRAMRELEERGAVEIVPSKGVFVTRAGHRPGT